jgi:hypothetical protein
LCGFHLRKTWKIHSSPWTHPSSPYFSGTKNKAQHARAHSITLDIFTNALASCWCTNYEGSAVWFIDDKTVQELWKYALSIVCTCAQHSTRGPYTCQKPGTFFCVYINSILITRQTPTTRTSTTTSTERTLFHRDKNKRNTQVPTSRGQKINAACKSLLLGDKK